MQKILMVDRITKSFGGLMAVNNVSMEIDSGEIVGVIGPNGAGKTTLFNCITGFFRPDQGEVVFRGRKVSGISPYIIVRQGMVRTFQNGSSFPALTVKGHLDLAMEMAARENREVNFSPSEILELLQLAPYRDVPASDLPHAIGTRLQIAVLLALRPYLILLDEPAAGMNNSETDYLKNFLIEINRRGITICLIEHNIRFVMSCCHRVIVLNLGSKLTEGAPETIKNDESVINAYLGSGVFA